MASKAPSSLLSATKSATWHFLTVLKACDRTRKRCFKLALSATLHIHNIYTSSIPFTLGYGGFIQASGNVVDFGKFGLLWLGEAHSSANAKRLIFSGYSIYPFDYGYKTSGYSVRSELDDHWFYDHLALAKCTHCQDPRL